MSTKRTGPTRATKSTRRAKHAAPADATAPLAPEPTDLEDAAAAYRRVEPAALALNELELTALNVDVVAATSVILGVAFRVLNYRERMAKLIEFDLRNADELSDRAKAAWYAAVTNMPAPEPKDFQSMLDEATKLRHHLLTWAAPLVHAEKFQQAAIDKIKEGAGNKDTASDVVALVALYRSKWDEVRAMCGVTEAELERGAVLGPALFAAISRRENKTAPSLGNGSLKVRRFWTLADRAYRQCQRAISYFEWDIADVTTLAPSLRRNAGPRAASPVTPPDGPAPTPSPSPPPGASPAAEPPLAMATPAGPRVDGASSS